MCRRPIRLFRFLFSLLLIGVALSVQVQADPNRFNTPKRYLYVQPGQTVGGIVKALYPDDQDKWLDIARRLVIANPHAFENGNVSKIIVGSRIEIPPAQSSVYASQNKARGLEVVGSATVVRGESYAIYTNKKRREIQTGSDVYVGDRLYTGAAGFIHLKMIDDAVIDLRCNSEMLIENYKMVPDNNTSVIHLLKGSLHKITGKIGKKITDRYEMHTPMATIGVRGTEYAVRVSQTQGCDGSVDIGTSGMVLKLDKGAIDVSNKFGDTSIEAPSALLIASDTTKPKAVTVKDGVFDAVKAKPPAALETPPYIKPVEPEPVIVEQKQGTSWWWIVLGVLVVAAL